ncbi:hypothetical protein RCL1_000814 [Eukaryota sp. TZLM3-RCL]
MKTSRQQTGVARPMTAVRAAGYSAVPKSRAGLTAAGFTTVTGVGGSSFNPFNLEPQQEDKLTHSKKIEREIELLVYESAQLTEEGDHVKALEKAKEAATRESSISQEKERIGQGDVINIDLTYTVLFNLACCYEKCELYNDALSTFNQIIENKRYAHAGRLKVNIGNIFFKQGNYEQAIKFYRMALDQVTSICKSVRLRIMRSIGLTFIKMNRWADGIEAFEAVLEEGVDVTALYHLCVCHYSLCNEEELKNSFQRLVQVPKSFNPDEKILKAAKLVIIINLEDLNSTEILLKGFDFVIEVLENTGWKKLSALLLLEKSVELMKRGDVEEALMILNSFSKKDESIRALAYPNLAFVNYHLGKADEALHYATSAVEIDPLNIPGLVNLSAICLSRGDYAQARDITVRALRLDVRCFEAMYNLALSLYGLGQSDDAIRALKKLHQSHSECSDVIWMVAVLMERNQDVDECLQWFNFLLARCPTDIGALRRVSEILAEEDDEISSLNCIQEAYRYFPVDIDVISKIAAHCVQHELYEKALDLFRRAAAVQPHKSDWKLMLGMCHRRMGEFQAALKFYAEVIEKEPDNKKCLKYLTQIYAELELFEQAELYGNKLRALETASGRRSARISRSARSVTSANVTAPMSARSCSLHSKTSTPVELDTAPLNPTPVENDDWSDVRLTDDMLPM